MDERYNTSVLFVAHNMLFYDVLHALSRVFISEAWNI